MNEQDIGTLYRKGLITERFDEKIGDLVQEFTNKGRIE